MFSLGLPMKIPQPFSSYDLRFTIGRKSGRASCHADVTHGACGSASNRQSSIANRQCQDGIALVITLIMLAITLVMAVAFLALAQRERNSVSTTTDTTIA